MFIKIIYNTFLVVNIFFIFTSITEAHHVRGLPSYVYTDNYQAIPMIEEIRSHGNLEIIFSYLQVFKSNNYMLAAYIRDKTTDKPYVGTVNFNVFGEHETPDKEKGFDVSSPMANTYRAGWTYEIDGLYTVRISFMDNGNKITEDFTLQAGKVGFNYLWIIIPSVVVILLIGLVLYSRKKEKKRGTLRKKKQ